MKAQHTLSIRCSAFGEQNHWNAILQTLADPYIGAGSVAPVVTADKYASCPARITPEYGPIFHLCLGNEDAG